MPGRDEEKGRADDDRRRSRRFTVGGDAKITPLPSDGIFLPARILDLSLHGCRVDSMPPIDYGVRAEIVLRINDASFRAVGEVRAVRGGSGAGIEFVQMSSGGKDMLADVIQELARFQTHMKKLTSARRDTDAKTFRRQVEEGRVQAEILSRRLPVVRTDLGIEDLGHSSKESSEKRSRDSSKQNPTLSTDNNRIGKDQPLVITVDLFV